jgi:glucose/arabinose dehydrogenase
VTKPTTGWSAQDAPTPVSGTVVTRFAEQLSHPRWVYALPNGDILVAETNAPPKPEDGKGIKAAFMKMFMTKAGAAVPSANRIKLLRDADGDGVAETRTVFLDGLDSPFGHDACRQWLLRRQHRLAHAIPIHAGRNQNRRLGHEGRGSAGRTAQSSLDEECDRQPRRQQAVRDRGPTATSPKTASTRKKDEQRYGKSTRKAARIVSMPPACAIPSAWRGSRRQTLWTAVNERDELGGDLVPDYMTSVRDGGFYGWPYSYYGQHVDTRVSPPRPELVASALRPDYARAAQASLGSASSRGTSLPPQFREGMFVGQHGSWNRNPPSGYRVIFVPFASGKPGGSADRCPDGIPHRRRHRARAAGGVSTPRGVAGRGRCRQYRWRVAPACRLPRASLQ